MTMGCLSGLKGMPMRITNRVVFDIETCHKVWADEIEYKGPVAMALGGTSMPAVTAATPPPSEDDEEVKKAKLAERRDLLRRYGASKTFLSGSRGLFGQNPTGQKTLLGE